MMEFKLILIYFLISASSLIQDTRTENVRVLQRVKRLDMDIEGDPNRVVRLQGDGHKAIRDRRSAENDESVPEDADDVSRDDDTSEEDTFKKSLYGSNFGQNTDDPTDVLKLSLSEFNSDQDESETIEEPIRKHFDKHFMKIKQKWKTAMRKRKQHKYQLKKKMTKRLKHKEAKDFAQLKSNRRRYHRQVKKL